MAFFLDSLGWSFMVKVAAPRMFLFFVTVVLYFALIGQTERQSVSSTILKCLPIVSLWIFVILTGIQLKKSYRYKHWILTGLIFSCLGDLLLNYDLFEAGMAAFGVAQIFYILAFGFKPLRPWLGLPLYGLGAAAVVLMFDNLPLIIKICLPIYGALLLTMCWRSWARIDTVKNTIRLSCGVGSALFVISDSIIAIDKFYTPVKNAQIAIMITYYVAQFGIALSVIDQTTTTTTTTTPKTSVDKKTANLPNQRQNGRNRRKLT